MLRVVIEELVPDGLWEQVAPLLPAPKPRPYRHHGRRRADDRAALAGIVFVLRHGVGWAQVPRAALGVLGSRAGGGCGSGLSSERSRRAPAGSPTIFLGPLPQGSRRLTRNGG